MIYMAGNWKMNTTVSDAKELAKEISKNPIPENVEAILCPPFTHLMAVRDVLSGSGYKLGAQNICHEDNGAFTGEVSGEMLKELGVDYVIIGHSERRQIFGEDDALILKKVQKALEHGLHPILCVGETEEERDTGKEKDIVKEQLVAVVSKLKEDDPLIVAYEPVWAIGTGKTATPEQAEEMCAFIKKEAKKTLGKEVPVQYGGSVKPENVEEILAKPSIDGALVGGASLKADSFEKLVKGKA